jgi:isopentenyl-diphosphate delta-isomerase
MDTSRVILVDENDHPQGTEEKLAAHRKGLLHRAFSIFIFNRKGEMLLQQRAISKYHSGGLWTNACCSHPAVGENTSDAAYRRLKEEMGFNTPLEELFSFVYKAEFENGLTEHEFDHVFGGVYEGPIEPDPNEVMDFCFMSLEAITDSLSSHSRKYSAWFALAFPKVRSWWEQRE